MRINQSNKKSSSIIDTTIYYSFLWLILLVLYKLNNQWNLRLVQIKWILYWYNDYWLMNNYHKQNINHACNQWKDVIHLQEALLILINTVKSLKQESHIEFCNNQFVTQVFLFTDYLISIILVNQQLAERFSYLRRRRRRANICLTCKATCNFV